MQTRTITTVEIALGVIMMAILVVVIMVVVNPSATKADGSDVQRRSDIQKLHHAISQYRIEHGDWPSGLDDDAKTAQVLGVSGSGCSESCSAVKTKDACLDISGLLVTEYLQSLPSDPDSGDFLNTDYYVNFTQSGKLIVGACDPVNIGAINVIH